MGKGTGSHTMFVFLADLRPRSVNARSKNAYQTEIQGAFESYYADPKPLDGNLYGLVYYFHNLRTTLDVDNLSKPIWDALKGVAYSDDNAIKLRSAGIFDLQSETLDILDLSQMPDNIFAAFLSMIDSEEHILYIEVGRLNYSLFRLGCEG